jgi:hypothetical protein
MKPLIMGLALTACLVHTGCDSNPGGPSAPSVTSNDSVNSSPTASNTREKKRGSKGSVAPISAKD